MRVEALVTDKQMEWFSQNPVRGKVALSSVPYFFANTTQRTEDRRAKKYSGY